MARGLWLCFSLLYIKKQHCNGVTQFALGFFLCGLPLLAKMSAPPVSMLSLLLLLLLHHALALQFEWQGAGDSNFAYDGDASVYGPHEVKLTIGVADAVFAPNAGRMRYAHPIALCADAASPASFNTSFTFQMSLTLVNRSDTRGDGIAFFVSPVGGLPSSLPTTKGLFGGLFGNSPSVKTLAVELDSSKESWDPNDNHVGVDLGSVVSVRTASLNGAGVVLTSGRSITTWIQYHGTPDRLDVYVAYADAAQTSPKLVLSVSSIKLCSLLKGGPAIVGFSSASRGAAETHDLYAWTWQSSL